ncbi:DUF4352 domain-containing protein [Streptomyces sp. NPDC048604]|uniref:DUF4352 domain-containing protein n=1 Tax=Streptomyces sp. NPDC048604 TaxID=3365578 RepID=UPI0037134E9E
MGVRVLLGLLRVIVIALFTYDGGTSDDKAHRPAPTSAAEQPAAKPSAKAPAKEEPASDSPVKVTATKTKFAKSILAGDEAYTSVKVTITNNGDETVDVNPLYFTITDTNGTKRTHELAADENQLDAVKLAPGENVSGVVTGKGAFTADYVTFTPGLFGDPVRVKVS